LQSPAPCLRTKPLRFNGNTKCKKPKKIILHSPAKKFKNTPRIEEHRKYQNAFTNHTSSPRPKNHTHKTPKPSPITTPENPSIKIFTFASHQRLFATTEIQKKKKTNKKESKKNNSLR
jgi:hypothetical protein